VSVVVQGAKATDLQVTRDGELLPAALIGVPHPEDPGTHTFKATATGMESAPSTLTLKEGAHETVVLTLNATAPTEPAAGTVTKGSAGFAADTENDEPKSGGPGLKIAAYSGIGLGAIGVGVGTYFLVKSGSSQKIADDLFDACELAETCDEAPVRAEVEAADAHANEQRTIGAISTVVGGAFLVTGITLLIVDLNGKSAAPSAARVRPLLGLNFAGVSGTF
jgi:hypothetical protein